MSGRCDQTATGTPCKDYGWCGLACSSLQFSTSRRKLPDCQPQRAQEEQVQQSLSCPNGALAQQELIQCQQQPRQPQVPVPLKGPGVLLKDPEVLLEDPGVLLEEPGVLLKEPGLL